MCVIHMLHSARSSSRPWASRIMQELVATSAQGAYNPEAMVNPQAQTQGPLASPSVNLETIGRLEPSIPFLHEPSREQCHMDLTFSSPHSEANPCGDFRLGRRPVCTLAGLSPNEIFNPA